MDQEEHNQLIEALRAHHDRVIMRGPPSTAVHSAIRALETMYVRIKELEAENKKLKQLTHQAPDSLN
jgi:hypothetical protein